MVNMASAIARFGASLSKSTSIPWGTIPNIRRISRYNQEQNDPIFNTTKAPAGGYKLIDSAVDEPLSDKK